MVLIYEEEEESTSLYLRRRLFNIEPAQSAINVEVKMLRWRRRLVSNEKEDLARDSLSLSSSPLLT
jgi:hypothetical protein